MPGAGVTVIACQLPVQAPAATTVPPPSPVTGVRVGVGVGFVRAPLDLIPLVTSPAS
jgi:hypothetical protein